MMLIDKRRLRDALQKAIEAAAFLAEAVKLADDGSVTETASVIDKARASLSTATTHSGSTVLFAAPAQRRRKSA